jgi:hypothetical protein
VISHRRAHLLRLVHSVRAAYGPCVGLGGVGQLRFLVRFRGPANNIIVTVRVRDVEQVFCTSEHGASIAFADLTVPSPVFVDVAPFEVEQLNSLVAAMIR